MTGFTEWTNVREGGAVHHFAGITNRTFLSTTSITTSAIRRCWTGKPLAKAHGIYGFCLYYYWFDGRRVLELPLNQMISRGKPDMPFCYCWANEELDTPVGRARRGHPPSADVLRQLGGAFH